MAYPTIDEIRHLSDGKLPDGGKYPSEYLEELLADFIDLAERYRGVAFIERTATETHTLDRPTQSIELEWPFVSEVESVTVDGEEQDGPWTVSDADRLAGPFWCSTVTVTYTHGIETPPAIRRAARLYVLREATSERGGGVNPQVAQNPELGFTEGRRSASWRDGRPTGWPDVDRLLNSVEDHRNRGPA